MAQIRRSILGALAVVLVGSGGARVSRKRSGSSGAKFVAGVPVLNYHRAQVVEASRDVEQEWVVVVQPGTTDAQIAAMCQASRRGCKLRGSPSRGGVPFLELRGTERDLEAVLLGVGAGLAKFVEIDEEVRLIPEIRDDAAAAASATWGLDRIGADKRSRAGAGATIYVLDTGVRSTHQEFAGRAASALDLTSDGEPQECRGDVNCAADREGHGTHCAGTAAGASYGVAPSATVRSIKLLSDQGGGQWSWSYSALNWLAVRAGKSSVVASMSLGGTGTQQAMEEAVDAAVEAGVVVVVAGGNMNVDACGVSPAFVPSAITVGSTSSTNRRSWFSNFGSCTNLWAPGGSVVSAAHLDDTGSATLSGTSMACPHVSGAVALLLEAAPTQKSPTLLARLLENAILDAVTDLKEGDTNALLYVGEGGPPTGPTPAPPAAICPEGTSYGPDDDGDCMCNNGLTCYRTNKKGKWVRECPYVETAREGWYSVRYFDPSCAKKGQCKCAARS